MEDLVRALLARLLPGQTPSIPVPQKSVMDPTRPDPLSRGEAERGAQRGLLDVVGGLPDLVTSGINQVPGIPGALVRGAMGKNPLPTDALAPALGVQGEGPAFETGRASTNAVAALSGLAGSLKPPPQGQVNMLVGRGAPAFDPKKGKQTALAVKKHGELFLHSNGLNDKDIARFVAARGQVYDPQARQVLQYVDTSDWRFDPKKYSEIVNGKEVPFGALFKGNPGKNTLPEKALEAPVFNNFESDGAVYHPDQNRIGLSLQSVGVTGKGPPDLDSYGDVPAVFRSHVFHEGQHAVQDALYLTPGINSRYVNAINERMSRLERNRDLQLRTMSKVLPEFSYRPVGGSRRLREAFRDSDYSETSKGSEGYRADIGEQIARHAELVAKQGVPARALNVFNNPETLLSPTAMGTPIGMINFLADAKARHPEMFKRMLNSHPELEDFKLGDRRFQEILGSRGFLGMPGITSPLAEAARARRAPPANWVEEQLGLPPFNPQP